MLESVGNLVDKLKKQHEAGAGAGAMMLTVQQIRNALLPQVNENERKNPGKTVSVILPGISDARFEEMLAAAGIENGIATPVAHEPKPSINVIAPAQVEKQATQASEIEPIDRWKPAEESRIAAKKSEEKLVFELDPDVSEDQSAATAMQSVMHDIPTFAQWPEQKEPVIPVVKEVNQLLQVGKPSLHEKLEALPGKELVSALQKEPIKDLKKAININERYQFINQLFKGDETVYERSIKTINSFNVYSEAEFWIRRELAMKLSWKEEDPVVRHFNELVTRRFL